MNPIGRARGIVRTDSEALYTLALDVKGQTVALGDGTTAVGYVTAAQAAVIEQIEALVVQSGTRIFPLWNGLSLPTVQFRGATDASATLGTLGFVFNASNDAEAAVKLATSQPDELSTINGSSDTGAWFSVPSTVPITTVHVGQIGMAEPLSLATSGTVDAATSEFMRWDFSVDDNIRYVYIHEGPPTDYAGTPGTGSARMVTVFGAGPEEEA